MTDSSTTPILWNPSDAFREKAYVTGLMKKLGAKDANSLRTKSVENIEAFWKIALEDLNIQWHTPYTQLLDLRGGIEWTKWFSGGETNIVTNCLDKHLPRLKDKTCILWEGDGGEVRKLTYSEFNELVSKAANGLKAFGVKPGDTVAILMPMIPEVVVQLYACLKIGAVAIPIFSGFGPEAIETRLQDADVKVLFTSDVGFRRGKQFSVKDTADRASEKTQVKTRVVFRRGDGKCAWTEGKDIWWDDFISGQSKDCPTLKLPAEATSLILFTSGTTGKPKGVIHTHGGCLATIGKELRYAFNVDEESRFFWFTDIGWMMGPWEMIGVPLFGGTLMLFEGAPDWPTPSRLWEVIDRHKLTHLGISPTVIRLLRKYDVESVRKHKLTTLQFLGSTGETWDPESYVWFFEEVGRKRCPIINISGGTEIIGCLLSPLPIDSLKSCSLGGPGLGVDADVWDENGKPVRGSVGHLVCKKPIPSMTKGFLKAKERYLSTYFSRWPGVWYHGDWARVDEDGQWFLHGRSDDTIKIAGKRVGPAEFEASLLSHSSVLEAAAIGVPDSLKGEACVCYVVLKPKVTITDTLKKELHDQVALSLGKALLPREIRFVSMLPKTRSAKIVRGLIRKIYLGEPLGDTSSVENLAALTEIREAK